MISQFFALYWYCPPLVSGFSSLAHADDYSNTIELFKKSPAQDRAGASAVAITAGAQAKAGTEGTTAGASSGPESGSQRAASYRKEMAVFVHAKGGLMYEAAIGGQRFSFKPAKGEK